MEGARSEIGGGEPGARKRIGRLLESWGFVVPITVGVLLGDGILATVAFVVGASIVFWLLVGVFFRAFPSYRPEPDQS